MVEFGFERNGFNRGRRKLSKRGTDATREGESCAAAEGKGSSLGLRGKVKES